MDAVERLRRLFASSSAIVLAAANLVPLLGVLFWRWGIGDVLLLYWVESGIIGVYNVVKMVWTRRLRVLFFLPFFCFHYGLFMFGHLVFIALIFIGRAPFADAVADEAALQEAVRGAFVTTAPVALALVTSHGYSFARHFVGEGEWRTTTVEKLMVAPYARIMLMQVTLVVGGGIALFLGSPLPALALMVVLKVLVDAWAHHRAHRRARPPGGAGAVH